MSARRARMRGPRTRAGMTLVEVIVAMFILTGVILVLGGFSAAFAQANAQAHLVISANEIAATRLDSARTQPSYGSLDAMVDSTQVTSDNTVFTRVTTVRRVGDSSPQSVQDYRLVTVRVTHPAMRRIVSKTTAITAF